MDSYARAWTKLSGRLLAVLSHGITLSAGLALAGSQVPVSAQTGTISPWDRLATPYVRHLTIPYELPDAATSITQDASGFIWVATQDGLVRWDGYRPKLFRHDPQDKQSLPSNIITGLVVNEGGTLFAAMEDGAVARYLPESEHFAPLPSSPRGIGLYTAFVGDGKGGLWLGNSDGLSHWAANSASWENVELPAGTQISSLLQAKDGTLWAGTDRGLMRRGHADSSFSSALQDTTHSTKSIIRALLQSSDGDIWFGTNDGHIGSLTAAGVLREVAIDHPASGVLSLAELPTGLICASTAGTGIIFVERATAKELRAMKFDPLRPNGLAEDFVSSLHVDKSGGLWIGHGGGADYLPSANGAIATLLPSERNDTALSGSHITSILARPDGSVWFASEKGVDQVAPVDQELEAAHQESVSGDKLPAALLNSMALSSSGQTWLGTGQGLFESKGGHLTKFHPLADTPIRTVITDKDVLWIGTEKKGLGRLDLKTRDLTIFQRDTSIPGTISDNFIIGMLNDPRHGLWIGTPHGLNLLAGQTFHVFMHNPEDTDSMPGDIVAGMLIDRRERLWVGTLGAGVAILEGDPLGEHHFRHIGRQQGLPSENIDSLIEDKQGRIWVGTDAGIAMIDPETLAVRSFSSADGVVITGHFPNSVARLADGTLLFGGLGGATIIHPDLVTSWAYKPDIAITSVRIKQTSMAASSQVEVPSDDHSLQVEFSALDYSSPERNKYAYKLDGFDHDWIVTDSDHRLAAYTNLAPGKYTLLLRGSNRAGIWADSPARLSVIVLPAWYQTIWFRIFILLSGMGAVAGLVRSRTAYLRRRQKELEGQVAERTSEIASLLHNSGEGFLSFGADLVIDRQYSLACETFLGENPAGKNAATLLFAENAKYLDFVRDSVPSALTSTDQDKRDLILSLLPKEIDRRGRRLKTQYAVLENGHLMMVLRDITTERRLAERVASEHRRLGMIVAAVADSRDFFATLETFRTFLASKFEDFATPLDNAPGILQKIYRQVHTFKGEFNQLSFEKVPAALHIVEEHLDTLRLSPESLTREEIGQALSSQNLLVSLEQDLMIIRKALGDEFLDRGGQVAMSQGQAREIKTLAQRWRRGETIDLQQASIRRLLEDIDRIGTVSLVEELLRHDLTIAQVALRLEKEVAPLHISGAKDIWIDPDTYGPFLTSLIHVFRNCVTHGIEAPDLRLEKGKNEMGHISCRIEHQGPDVEIAISDDGAGIDFDALRRQAIELGHLTAEQAAEAPDDKIAGYIFHDHVSTARQADQWAGRGIGLAVVRQEIEALGGTVFVTSGRNQGTQFTFRFTLRHAPSHLPA